MLRLHLLLTRFGARRLPVGERLLSLWQLVGLPDMPACLLACLVHCRRVDLMHRRPARLPQSVSSVSVAPLSRICLIVPHLMGPWAPGSSCRNCHVAELAFLGGSQICAHMLWRGPPLPLFSVFLSWPNLFLLLEALLSSRCPCACTPLPGPPSVPAHLSCSFVSLQWHRRVTVCWSVHSISA